MRPEQRPENKAECRRRSKEYYKKREDLIQQSNVEHWTLTEFMLRDRQLYEEVVHKGR